MPSHMSPHSVGMGHPMDQGNPSMQHSVPQVFYNHNPLPNPQVLPHSGAMLGPRPSLLPDGHSQQGMVWYST